MNKNYTLWSDTTKEYYPHFPHTHIVALMSLYSSHHIQIEKNALSHHIHAILYGGLAYLAATKVFGFCKLTRKRLWARSLQAFEPFAKVEYFCETWKDKKSIDKLKERMYNKNKERRSL